MPSQETTFTIPVSHAASAIDRVLNAHGGILRLAPAWVPRAFCTPGRRLRLHPDDYYPFAKGRGGIDERWLGSAIRADNGPGTGPYEGLSLAVDPDEGVLVPLDEIVETAPVDVIGQRMWKAEGGWAAYSKFYDNLLPLPFHMHPMDKDMLPMGLRGKPEAYYYSPQMNNYLGEQSIMYIGLNPETSPEEIVRALSRHERGGDNRITDYSQGYRTRLGQGWDVPAGILHAPSSVCTYEPQRASDVLSMFESWSNNMEVGTDLLWKDVPPEHHGDLEHLVGMLDWEANVDPDFHKNRTLIPYATAHSSEHGAGDFVEKWIVYKSSAFSAKELTVMPGRSATIPENDAYGIIAVQGHGRINDQPIGAITMVRIHDLTRDEYFVTAAAASRGVTITNESDCEPLVLLKHYGPGNVELGI
ncbi:hypothetical protein M3T53_07820 [Actinomyces sp. B33]|uniref:hypothetical protein n=1 Tax=Actinomyces sp. B33 TaxID=2942131 RepID=UPI00234144EB|nr:hypothetical protein [Actinomyces sp. B33]MDC4233609.1 hypothetical protein [Actinomyces sp. B33]